ncbi:RNA polymerase sporulation sigma factor SigK [Bacillota bacterium Meth-B3]|nr:RNA polymerase sporulation sigma factor SigK [Christensenellaceae bacterium]MEA5064428.1 RNA polymerase sporulation sigma factor SigK [Eubacteriales bacterium]
MLTALIGLLDSIFLLIAHVSGRSSFPQPLSAEEERAAIERMMAGDTAAAKTLIEHNLRLVAHIAKKYQRSGVDMDDLVSIGSIGLIKAVSSFKPEAGKLTSYASRCVENEILMALRAGKKRKGSLSLSEPIGADREGNEVMLSDILGTDFDLVPRQAEVNIESARAILLLSRVLDARERTVIVLRYGLLGGAPRPQHEVARELDISRSYVSRIEKRAIEKLREALNGTEDPVRPGGQQ